MSQIWKFVIPPRGLIEMPVGAEVVTVATQRDDLCIWALVGQTEHTELRDFVPVPTGAEFEPLGLTYIGTCHNVDGWMVFHIYERERD